MAKSYSPRLDSFPDDNLLYQVYWGGELLDPQSEEFTPRIRYWLQQSDDRGVAIPDAPFVEVTESISNIPLITLGSYWQSRMPAFPPFGDIPSSRRLELVTPEKWSAIRAGDLLPTVAPHLGRRHTAVNPSDKRLIFRTSSGRRVLGHNAWVVIAQTTDGQEVILPSYEIFRAFFGGTSELALALLTQTWNRVEDMFIIGSQVTTTERSMNWHLDLVSDSHIPGGAVPYLTMLHFDKATRDAANRICAATVNQDGLPWISAVPPLGRHTFNIKAYTTPLPSRKALLVTHISSFDVPVSLSKVTYSVVSSISLPTEDEPSNENSKTGARYRAPSTARISRPADRRPTGSPILIPSPTVMFKGLPRPKRIAREERIVPGSKGGSQETNSATRTVSTGAKGKRHGTLPGGQIAPEVQRQEENRFDAILSVFDELVKDGKLTAVHPCPLVRPMLIDGLPAYCAFEDMNSAFPWSWSMLRNPTRPRAALVMELCVGRRLVYWIETEVIKPSENRRALVFEMRSGESVDEGTLELLLRTGVEFSGRWPKRLSAAEDSVYAIRRKHSTKDGHMLKSTVIGALHLLTILRKTGMTHQDAC